MKEIVVLSGKGGTGKTSVTAAFAALSAENIVLADCDVDAADMHLLMAPETEYEEDFYSGKTALIHTQGCTHCYKCINVCRFDAISVVKGDFTVDPLECEGCSYCFHVCPTRTIEMKPRYAGKFYISKTRFNNTLVHARLGIAADNSGKLVSKVREAAKERAQKENKEYILIDASPGIGCPVVASLTGAGFVVLVVEPTVSGIHDLKRVYDLISKLKLQAGCIVNKRDINPEITNRIKNYLSENRITLLGEIPYDIAFTQAISAGKTVVEYDRGELRTLLVEIWEKVKTIVNNM